MVNRDDDKAARCDFRHEIAGAIALRLRALRFFARTEDCALEKKRKC
jgi:hypothetical protein